MNKDDEDIWSEIVEFLLKVQRHPRFKPETIKEAQKSLECILAIRSVIRSIGDDEKYIEMIIMADENEEFLKSTLEKLEKEK